MTTKFKKKLIEVALPLEAINAASAREKSIRHGHPSTLHLWWARRPLAACRAILFAQLVDDPSGYANELLKDSNIRGAAEEELIKRIESWESVEQSQIQRPHTPKPTLQDCAVDIKRKHLFRIIEDLVKWENSTNEQVLESARAEINNSFNGELPSIYDPFSGGGSIPLEAQRLGLPAYGSDLNPVAVMIGKAMIEIPPKFKDQPPVHPEGQERNCYRYAEGLAEDVKYYGEWIRKEAFALIGHMYPQVELPKKYGGKKANVIAWIWSRTVPSPDPAFSDVEVPIASSFLLNSKKGKEAWVEPIVDKLSKTIIYEVRSGGTENEIERAKKGTKAGRGANFRCLISNTAITTEHVRGVAKSRGLGSVLIAIVVEGVRGRVYLAPQASHVFEVDCRNCKRNPDLKISKNRRAFTPPDYGMEKFSDLFTNRQLMALNTFSQLVSKVRQQIEQNALASGLPKDSLALRDGGKGAKAYAEAVSVYLAFALDRAADAWSSQVSWIHSSESSRSTFARQALAIVWDYAELNPFSNSNGNWSDTSIAWIERALAAFRGNDNGRISQCDAQTVEIPDMSIISTDPPYYDNINYADLADFFFCWMKPTLGVVYPDLFGFLATPKTDEIIADPYRHGGKEQAKRFFLQGMSDAVTNMACQTSEEVPATIYYAFKQSEIEKEGIASAGWATFLRAVIDAGYAVVGTWPLRTEKPGRSRAIGANALSNSIVLVCRQKEKTAETITRAEFIRSLKRKLPLAIAELKAANIAPADMPQSAIGPGMGVFSQYKSVLEADDSPMTVKTALQLINRELDDCIGGVAGDFDAGTRFAITWFEQNGMKAGDYGMANNIATARGISVENVRQAGIVVSSAGRVRLLQREELDPDWDIDTDPYMTVWKCLQCLIRQHEQEGVSDGTALLLKKFGDKVDAVKDLAYCLYDISTHKHQDPKEGTAYNALITDWKGLTRLAATTQDIHGNVQMLIDT